MKPTKESTHAFIVRIWIEPREVTDANPLWRGVIEDVDRAERVYFDQLEKMNTYFARYLEKIGIKPDNIEK